MTRFVPIALAWLLVAGCSGKEEGPDTAPHPLSSKNEEFCDWWAEAACNEDVVHECAAVDTNACVRSQRQWCMGEAPSGQYVIESAEECLDAVEAGYEDAQLTRSEYDTVRRFGPPCDELRTGPGEPAAEGSRCVTTRDCGSPELICAIEEGAATGTCETPDIRSGGQICSGITQVCDEGFYCDTESERCYERPGVGGACSELIPCREDLYCDATEAICQTRSAFGEPCTGPEHCQSGLCDLTANICVDEIDLAPGDPLCQDLR
jgi:hypothetical protein